jgi:hypothetical protein
VNAPRPAYPRAALAGPLLLLVGVACWALFAAQSRSEHHAYNSGTNPPEVVRVVAGQTYAIAIHGGVAREAQLGLDPAALRCTATQPGNAPGALRLTTENGDTKANDQIASFVSRISGDVQVRCDRIGAVYVDDAAGSSFDWSGLWLVLASIALVIGLPLTLSLVRGRRLRAADSADRPVREDDEVERGVDA